jgi:hypothetical protein
MRRIRPSAASNPIRGATRSSVASRASTSCHFCSVWYSAELKARSPGKPSTASASPKARAQSAGDCAPKNRCFRNSA